MAYGDPAAEGPGRGGGGAGPAGGAGGDGGGAGPPPGGEHLQETHAVRGLLSAAKGWV